jgi:alkanesulfonate monooxygenase SsuD/methylene tetrahydromethanopterin reductase-like flavin-dependent oxidoreductase (luciferase family)
LQFDVFFSICQTEVDGQIPSERTMFQNFFRQLKGADELGYGTAWIAESHLSCEVQKELANAVIPNFKGEIGLNTDVLLLASKAFNVTRKIEIGSAIRSLFVNGGPMAHAEAVKSFLTLHGLEATEKRKLHLGFAAGRFPFSSQPYGIVPRNAFEEVAWPVIKGKIFLEACEIFLRFLGDEAFSSNDVTRPHVSRADFRSEEDWNKAREAALEFCNNALNLGLTLQGKVGSEDIFFEHRWNFQKSGVMPFNAPLELCKLVVGSHDESAQLLCNKYMPCGVFNLSITPGAEIEKTHQRMKAAYHAQGGGWKRSHMPRTVLVFLNGDKGLSIAEQRNRAQAQANRALTQYWNALEGTLDPARIQRATDNALIGSPADVVEQLKTRFHPEDRLMLWFDFFNHNTAQVEELQRTFMEEVAPHV